MVLQVANPSVAALYEDALVYETGSAITSSGALSAYSGAKTGRSPSDKRIVREPSSEKEIWWGPVNKEMSPDVSTFHIPDLVDDQHMVAGWWPELFSHICGARVTTSTLYPTLQ